MIKRVMKRANDLERIIWRYKHVDTNVSLWRLDKLSGKGHSIIMD